MAFPNENQKIFMVTGKGGVGKSVVAAALAQRAAKSGLKTLLVELGEQSFYQYVYHRTVGYEPVAVSPNFSIALWGGHACLREYVYHLVRVKPIVDLFFDNRVMRTFIRAAPALKELAILGKLTSGIRAWGPELPYDLIVVDAFATGHFEALLNAPRGMAELIEAGPMGEQSRNIMKVLERPDLVEYKIVTLPEELPVSEALEQVDYIKKNLHSVPKLFLNRVYQSPLNMEELSTFGGGKSDPSGKQFVDFLMNLHKRQNEQIHILQESKQSYVTLPWVLHFDAARVVDGLERALPT